jgi:hypothetical protein
MEQIKDFSDLVDAVLETRKADAIAKHAADKAAAAELQETLEKKLKPLLTAIRQTKAKHPQIVAIGCDLGDVRAPYFYTDGNRSIHLVYDANLSGRNFRLEDRRGPAKVLAISANVEDLIPPLIDLLATAVTYTRGQRQF